MAEQHELPPPEWQAVQGSISTTATELTGDTVWLAVSAPVPVTAGSTVEWEAEAYRNAGNNADGSYAFLSLGDELSVPASGIEPDASGDTVVLDFTGRVGADNEILTATVPRDGNAHLGAWYNNDSFPSDRGLRNSFTLTVSPPPAPPVAAEILGTVLTITGGTEGDTYVVATDGHDLELQLGAEGTATADLAPWDLPPGSYSVNVTGPGLDVALELQIQDPFDELVARLAPRVAAYVGRAGDQATLDLAAGQLLIVAEFVRGYTRDRGWSNDTPTRDIAAVIVSVAARAAMNPEQVRQYSAGDYSETPSLLVGFTLAERAVLDRHRKRWA